MPWFSRFVVLLLLPLFGCGVALQQASVTRSFQARFGCQTARMSRVSDGYHVEGCGRRAEYVCLRDSHDVDYHTNSIAGAFAAGLLSGFFAGANERCVLAHSEQELPAARVASSEPSRVGRVRGNDGRVLLKTRMLFAGGYLRAVAAPREHPGQVLLIVHSVARMQDAPCTSELFHDGVPVPVLAQKREGNYEARLVVPVAALAGAQQAVRFAGSVCGSEFALDASGRTTLGLFASHCQEERTRALHGEPVAVRRAAPAQPAPLP